MPKGWQRFAIRGLDTMVERHFTAGYAHTLVHAKEKVDRLNARDGHFGVDYYVEGMTPIAEAEVLEHEQELGGLQ